ncbi:hypothetical protein QJ48_04260 [Paenibacillus sp. A3]|uniref:BC1872 family protein n=1 Tax=Paenibacillus sp. A3 TaxID=1337054 RepID=UPI0006D54272|nr:hypothetical protein [Paenibacillus sp. A3]KPV60742.1 hypothetical protein QJ48_04260 [Paenibacillus sp. A3]
MNEQQIRDMKPGPEMDRLIAKTLYNARPCGLEGREDMFIIIGDFGPNDARPFLGGWYDRHWSTTEEKAWESIPKYSIDISAAWEIFVKFDMPILKKWFDQDDTDWYTCRIGTIIISARTAPEAICKAALLAIGGAES